MKIVEHKTCRLCQNSDLVPILDLGMMPPANSFLSEQEIHSSDYIEKKFPLAVQFCQRCCSLQLRHTVDPELLFNNYHYVTGASRPLVEHFYSLADEIAGVYIDSSTDLVVEIGSNDGSLLSRLVGKCKILGVDPAQNIAYQAVEKAIPTKIAYFNTTVAKEIKDDVGEAKVVVANNVMAHIDNLPDVFRGVRDLLHESGTFIFEVHWVGNLLHDGGFDQIYHEHIFYHSLHSLDFLLRSVGMQVVDVTTIPIHGQSLRVYARKNGPVSESVKHFLDKEKEMGLHTKDAYVNFSKKVEKIKKELMTLIYKLKKEGKIISGYGAPAKGNTLLNYFGIGPEILDYIVDTTPSKQGKFTPGTHIKVVHPEILISTPPDYLLLLSWNYRDAILDKEKTIRDKGIKFIIPIPQIEVV